MNTHLQDEMAGALRRVGFVEATCKASGSIREFVPGRPSSAIGSVQVLCEGIAFLLPPAVHDREKAAFVTNVPGLLVDEILKAAPFEI